MKIGELARRTGLTASRIRFYESLGLLPMVERMPNGYRHYPKGAQLVLELIDTAQQAGFSLDEIRTLLPTNLENGTTPRWWPPCAASWPILPPYRRGWQGARRNCRRCSAISRASRAT